MTIEERLRSKVVVDGGGCWRWQGHLTRGGYAGFSILGRFVLGHRVAYELFVGEIPEGLQLDHLCRVRDCVNPEHLEPVTTRENLLRGSTRAAANAAKTHCPKGHEYTPENTRNSRGAILCRRCKTCEAASKRARRERQRLARPA